MSKVIYEPHPVSAERKKELMSQGFKILDKIYEPDDVESPEISEKKPAQIKQKGRR